MTHADEVPSTLGRRQRTPARESYPISRARRGLSSTREQYANLHPHLERHPSTTSERLEDINSSLHHLLDPSSFHQGSFSSLDSYLNTRSPQSHDEDRQRQKRRKLDHPSGSRKELANIRYGHHGQVVAGQLRMKLVSCDGGQLRDHDPRLHRPENVLSTDKSVYCTEKSQCTLLLEHADGTSFSLEKLVIKGPDKGFTAPVQQGLVFVSNSPKGLISSASQYFIPCSQASPRYTPREHPRTPEPRRNADREQRLTLLEAINDSDMWETSQRQRNRSVSSEPAEDRPDTARYWDENERSWVTADEILSGRFDDPNYPPLGPTTSQPSHDPAVVLSPQDFRAPTPPLPPAQICITTSTDDPSISPTEQEADSTAPDILADRVIRESRMRNISASSAFHEDFDNGSDTARYNPSSMYGYPSNPNPNDADNTDGDDLLPPLERMWPDSQQRGSSPYGRRPPPPPNTGARDRWAPRRYPIGPPPPLPPGAYAMHRRARPFPIVPSSRGEETMGAEGGLLQPTTAFFIPEDKAAIAVKFDPPICGRWLCVRLFSPVMGGNIDVQSVVAYGYAGQRFFPACEPV